MDLKKFLPERLQIVDAIYNWYEKKNKKEEERSYLGASQLGMECERALWFTFRKVQDFDTVPFKGRMLRLFNTGNREETRFVEELKGIGCQVHEIDENTGKQYAVYALGGHLGGHLDGIALGIPDAPKSWHVLEFKTHNEKSFNALIKEGVKAAKPQHYAQMQIYMGLTKIDRALYLAVNKNNDELHAERVKYCADDFKSLLALAERVVRQSDLPARCATRSDDYRCNYCAIKKTCWGGGKDDPALPVKDIRCEICCHATPEIDDGETWARWSCRLMQKDLSLKDRKLACSNHLVLPVLIRFAEPIDSSSNSIKYQNIEDKAEWSQGGADGEFSTLELTKSPECVIGHSSQTAKSLFGGTVKEVRASLFELYSVKDNRLIGPVTPEMKKWIDAQNVTDTQTLDGCTAKELNGEWCVFTDESGNETLVEGLY